MSCWTTIRRRRVGQQRIVDSLNRRQLKVENSRVRRTTSMSTERTPAYSPGLAGVIAGETQICSVDPNAGLTYRGYDIHEMAEQASFEEVAYLLLNGELPNLKNLAQFRQQIAAERELPAQVVKMLRLMPRSAHPMDMLRTGVSMLGVFDPELNDNSHAANVRKSIRLIARVSTLITDGWLKEKLVSKAKIMGFGHRVYKKGDSRVPVMREIGRDLGKRTGKEQWIPICEKLEEVMGREKHLCANVDLYAAPVFWMLGFPPQLNTPIFAASRVAGWCAHVTEQHDNNRLIRPRSRYVGPKLRPYPGSPSTKQRVTR